ncbi:hypothetical protein LTR70_000778 [Exophiala xenobiotica]|nr:hypothetical protein LTR70_000778 [Exophiala xenobiotica]
MSSKFHWALEGLDESRFQAFISLLRLRNGGQLSEPCDGDDYSDDELGPTTSGPDTDHREADSTNPQQFTTFDERELRRRFLDRTAELVSGVHGGSHVTSTLLAEWPGKAQVLVAKNNLPSESDLGIIQELQKFIEVVARSNDLKEAYEEVDMNTAAVTGKAMDDSPKAYQLTSMLEKLRQTAGNPQTDEISWHELLIRKAYQVRTHWLESCVDHFRSCRPKSISKLQQRIFFLARLRIAFNVIVRAARKIPSFENLTITFDLSLKGGGNDRSSDTRGSYSQAPPWSLSRTFNALGLQVSTANLKKVLRKSVPVGKAAAAFDKLQQGQRHVHAEIKLLLYSSRNSLSKATFFDYLGCSKRSCYICWNALASHGHFRTRGSHGKLYNRWTMPETEVACDAALKKLQTCVIETEKKLVSTLLCEQPAAVQHVKESTAGNSSLASMPFYYLDDRLSAISINQYMQKQRLMVSRGAAKPDNGLVKPPDTKRSPLRPSPITSPHAETNDSLVFSEFVVSNSSGMPSGEIGGECGHCEKATTRRCSLCGRDWYCSGFCQRKCGTTHRFRCAGGSLTTADYLYEAIMNDEIPDDPPTVEDYGFHRCTTWNHKSHLLGLYKGLWLMEVESGEIDQWRREGILVEKIAETFERLPQHNRGSYYPWFLRNKHLLSDEALVKPDPKDVMEKGFEEGRPLLSSKDQKKDVGRLKPAAKRYGFVFLAMCSQACLPPPGLAIEGVNLWYELGFPACRNEHAEKELGRLYHRLLFGDKLRADYNRSLGTEWNGDKNTKTCKTCTFDEFWKKWEAGKLVQLLNQYGLSEECQKFADLDIFLAYPLGARRPSVFRLRHWLEEDGACPPEAEVAARTYGFSDNLNARQEMALKDIYKRLFEAGTAMQLHHALCQGGVFEHAQTHVKGIEPDIASILEACKSD